MYSFVTFIWLLSASVLAFPQGKGSGAPKAAAGEGTVKGKQCGFFDNITGAGITVANYNTTDGSFGSGPYKAWYTTDLGLPRHTIYLPKQIPAGLKLPVVTFAEGGCQTNGLAFVSMLTEWASHGFMVIADGPPVLDGKSVGSSDKSWTKEALDFITKKAGQGKYANVDASRIGVSGQSCGGMVAYNFANDPRVSTLFIFNSGAFPTGMQGQTADAVKTFTKPIGYAIGGPTDIAYQNGERDYKNIPAGTPKFKGNIPAGHGGTFCQPRAGQFGQISTIWWKWLLRGDPTAAEYFLKGKYAEDGWAGVAADLNKAKTPSLLVSPK